MGKSVFPCLFPVPAGPADHLRAERDVEPEGDERERRAAAAEGDAATCKVGIHNSHHRREGGDEKQECHKANKNRASASRAGGFFLDESHSGSKRSASFNPVQLPMRVLSIGYRQAAGVSYFIHNT